MLVLLLVSSLFHPAFVLDDPERSMFVPEIIHYWGYPAEIHHVTTDDGYILTLHRIPFGKSGQTVGEKKKVVFLQHGLLASSSNWVTNLPHLSLAFLLADAGCDVWMGNSRGNLYGKTHNELTPDDKNFWIFSWDEMAQSDLPASIDYVLSTTAQPHLYYVGHSQGTLIMFSKLSSDPSFKNKIRQFHALAPIISAEYIRGALRIMSWFPFDLAYQFFGIGEMLLTHENPLNFLVKLPCKNPVIAEICSNFLFATCGYSSNQLNATRIPVFLSDYPSGTSTRNILHWLQMARTGQTLRRYDHFWPWVNMRHYGSPLPPFYYVDKIETPMWLYWSAEDWLSTERDIEEHLLPNLQKKFIKRSHKLENFNHLDFVWGNQAAELIYKPMIRAILDDVQ